MVESILWYEHIKISRQKNSLGSGGYIIEGCYIPFDYKNYFSNEYLNDIKYICLVMSSQYIINHFDDIKKYANIIEKRIDDDCSLEMLLNDNEKIYNMVKQYNLNHYIINDEYSVDINL